MSNISKFLIGMGIGMIGTAAFAGAMKSIHQKKILKENASVMDLPEIPIHATVMINGPVVHPASEGIKSDGYFMIHQFDLKKYNPDIDTSSGEYVRMILLTSNHEKYGLVFHPESGEISLSTFVGWDNNNNPISAIVNSFTSNYVPVACVEKLRKGDQLNIKFPAMYIEGLNEISIFL